MSDTALESAQRSFVSKLGVYVVPFATEWGDAPSRLLALYSKQLASLPWVPSSWVASVSQLNGSYQSLWGNKVIALPASSTTLRAYGTPSFLDTAEKIQAWNELNGVLLQAYQSYASGKADEGRSAIIATDNDLAFWTRLHQIASIVGAPVGYAGDAINATAKNLWFPILLAGGLLLAVGYARRGK